MPRSKARTTKAKHAPVARVYVVALIAVLICASLVYIVRYANLFPSMYEEKQVVLPPVPVWPAPLDTAAYNAKMLALAHITLATSTTASTTSLTVYSVSTATTSVSVPGRLWPVGTVYPQGGAILPFHRIVAYYGNFYSPQMGILGEYPPQVMIPMLQAEVNAWQAADPSTPVLPAIQYIAVVAQGSAGSDGKYRLRMPDSQIDEALALANQVHGILILDVQVGESTLPAELPALQKYLEMPQVELAIDPEFSMKYGNPPGTVIGTFDASDINYAAVYLASLVREYHLPPKILIVHRFTDDMVTNYKQITPLPQVQIVMDMDGWGSQAKKIGTYTNVIAAEPVQFTGFKLFYKADLRPPSTGMLTPEQVLKLTPAPIYIQYQ